MRHIFLVGPALILFAVALCHADLETERKRESKQPVPPSGVRSYTEVFVKGKLGRAIVSGNGNSCLSLYVFDARGNCVARDDVSEPKTSDDLYAEWLPDAQQAYSVEIRNAGYDLNEFRIVLR